MNRLLPEYIFFMGKQLFRLATVKGCTTQVLASWVGKQDSVIAHEIQFGSVDTHRTFISIEGNGHKYSFPSTLPELVQKYLARQLNIAQESLDND